MQDRFTTFTIQISRLHKLIQKLKTDGMGRFGLKAVDTLCLYQLAIHGTLTFSEVAALCDLDAALVSRTLSALVKGGMVAKEGAPGKYRARYSLTEQGQALTEKITHIIETLQVRADDGIDPEELRIFYRVLGQLTANFEQMTKASVFSTSDPNHQEEPSK